MRIQATIRSSLFPQTLSAPISAAPISAAVGRCNLAAGVAAWSLLATLSAPALAQTAVATNPDELRMAEEVVTATRTDTPANALPTTVTLIGQEVLSDQLLLSTSLLDAVAARVPSAAPTRQKLTGLGESLRGRKPLIMIDGVPQTTPLRDGNRDGFTIDPSAVERIEVLNGANAIQGVGGTGGIINYVTLSPKAEPGWEVRYELGATVEDGAPDDGTSWRGVVTGLGRQGQFDVVLSLAGESRGLFRDGQGRSIGVDAIQGDIQDSESQNLFVKLGWEPDDLTRVQLLLNTFDLAGEGNYIAAAGNRAAGVPVTSARGAVIGVPPENIVRTYALDATRQGLWGGKLTGQLFRQEFESVFGGGFFADFQDPRIPTQGLTVNTRGQFFDQSSNQSDKTGLKLAWTGPVAGVEGLDVTAGLDWIEDVTAQELIATGRDWVPETTFASVAPFVQLEQALFADRLRLSAGVRQEQARLEVATYDTLFFYGPQRVQGGEPEFSETLLNAGVSFEALPGLTVFGAFAEGFTMPDVGRVLRDVRVPNQSVATLLNLQPIVADNLEVGARFRMGGISASVSAFRSESEFGQRLVPNADGFFFVVREQTEIEGIEAQIEAVLNPQVSVGATAARLEGRFDSNADGRVDQDLGGVNISPDRFSAFLAWQPHPRVNTQLQVNHYADRSFDDPGTATDFTGYTLLDQTGGYDFGPVGRVELGVQNLTNETYITYYSQAGSTVASRYFAGRGRTVTLRWRGGF